MTAAPLLPSIVGGISRTGAQLVHNEAMKQVLLFAALLCLPAQLAGEVSVTREGDRIDVAIDGQPFTSFFFGPEATKPYLHPLRAADGTTVTRSYPMEQVAGEQTDHAHHRGAWFSHGDVNGVDFWANEVEQRGSGSKGMIVLDAIKAIESGAEKGRIEAAFAWQNQDGQRLLTEHRTMTFFRSGDHNLVEFDLALSAAAQSVKLGDTKEGTFAVRMATELEEQHMRARGVPRTGKIANADGAETEAKAWGKRSRWVDYSGSIGGKPMGVAIFDHPANPKHPTYWHVRGYGLFAANAFGEHDFHADPSRDGSITLAKGEILRFRYRIVIHPGRSADADLNRAFQAWAAAGSK